MAISRPRGRQVRPVRRERLAQPVALRVAAQHLDQQAAGVLREVGGGRRAQQPAAVEDDDVVADLLQLAEQVRGDEHRDAEVATDALHEVEHVDAGRRVEAVGGLVEEDQPRVVHERLRELGALLHAGGVAAHLAVALLVEADVAQDVGRALAGDGRGQAGHPAHVDHEVAGAHVGRQAVVLGHVADEAADLRALASRCRGRGRDAVPLVGSSRPSRILISVDLPAPLAPTSPVTPSPTEMSSAVSASTSPKRIVSAPVSITRPSFPVTWATLATAAATCPSGMALMRVEVREDRDSTAAMDNLTVIVLAAGGGTRMKSKTMKVLHPIGGRSMIGHVLTAVQAMEPQRIVAVVGHQRDQVGPHIQALVPDVVLAVQETQDGTGHAVRVAIEAAGTTTGTVIVAAGDTPLLRGESLREFAAEHEAAQRAVSILSGIVANPFGYGRIIRNAEGDVEAIVEEKDATPEQRLIAEINSGILAFDAEFLLDALPRIKNDNNKGEYYLTDTVQLARDAGLTVGAHAIDDVMQTEGANDRVQLAELGRVLNERIVAQWMRDGVTVMDPATTWIDADVQLAQDVTILPGTQLLGATIVAEDAVIGPDTTLKDCEIGAGARVVRTHGELAVIGDRATVGPFSYLRPGTQLGDRGQDRRLRRDQERPDRRRRQGAAPVLRRRRGDRRGHQHRRRHDLRQLRRRQQAPHRRGQARTHRVQQHVRRAGHDRRRRGDRGRDDGTPRRTPRSDGREQRSAAQPRGLGAVEDGPARRRQTPRHARVNSRCLTSPTPGLGQTATVRHNPDVDTPPPDRGVSARDRY